MDVVHNLTIVTANLGRGATINQFEANVKRMKRNIPGKNVFYCLQEIDEDDKPEEKKFIREVYSESHRFVAGGTRTPILVPKSFKVADREVVKTSDGIAGVQGQRNLVRARVYPEGFRQHKLDIVNAHASRKLPKLARQRKQDFEGIQKMVSKPVVSLLGGDLNLHNYPLISQPERKLVTTGVDYIRAYPVPGVQVRLIRIGRVRLVGDGHNAQWAQLHITWT